MKWLEIIKRLGESAKDDEEKELLGDYFERLRTMVRRECTEEELEHRFCLMMAGYIMRYVTKQVDYSKTDAEYYLTFLRSRLQRKAVTA